MLAGLLERERKGTISKLANEVNVSFKKKIILKITFKHTIKTTKLCLACVIFRQRKARAPSKFPLPSLIIIT